MDKQMWSTHTVESDSAIVGSEVLTPAPTRVDLQNLMLSEINQSPKDRSCVIPLI